MAFALERLATTIAAGPPALLLVLFGSAATDRMHDGSDVDLGWIPVDPDLSLGDELAFQARLTGAAGREVDLVRLDRASTICRHEVASDGIQLSGDRGEFVRFRAESIGDYLDFEPALPVAGTTWHLRSRDQCGVGEDGRTPQSDRPRLRQRRLRPHLGRVASGIQSLEAFAHAIGERLGPG